MLKLTLRILAAAIIFVIASSSLPAQQNSAMDDVIHTLFAGREFDQTAISPDGTQVAWVEKLVDKNG
ncbi:MAG TPA: hypothetical protein VKE71_08675, partial [Candidatus Angelobacter sp.]|nr:hypothetical protein [Candidatus Angelobacter sp.]